jgi:hypothetical protein
MNVWTRIHPILDKCKKLKKDKHLSVCLEQRGDFTPLLYTVGSMPVERPSRLRSEALAEKWHREYS